jgi:hypothetical protein
MYSYDHDMTTMVRFTIDMMREGTMVMFELSTRKCKTTQKRINNYLSVETRYTFSSLTSTYPLCRFSPCFHTKFTLFVALIHM